MPRIMVLLSLVSASAPSVPRLAGVPGMSATVASAHTGGTTTFVTITVSGNALRYSASLFASAAPAPIADSLARAQAGQPDARATLVTLFRDRISVVADGTRCEPAPGGVLPPDADPEKVTVVVDFACARTVRNLALRDDTFDVLGADHHTLVKLETGAATQQLAFEPGHRDARVTITDAGAAGEGGTSFVLLGIHHILSGWDHLLFLLALLLRGGTVLAMLKIVTAFTVAHSVTLALAVLDVVTLPDRLIECVIALSIAFVAAENLAPRRSVSARWVVSFAFGLVHGFGFSSALRELGLPRTGLAASLLGFNLGVEAGQAIVVAIALPALLVLARAGRAPLVVRACSATILVIGLALFVERALGGP
jgi:HupE/UreJ protein